MLFWQLGHIKSSEDQDSSTFSLLLKLVARAPAITYAFQVAGWKADQEERSKELKEHSQELPKDISVYVYVFTRL